MLNFYSSSMGWNKLPDSISEKNTYERFLGKSKVVHSTLMLNNYYNNDIA